MTVHHYARLTAADETGQGKATESLHPSQGLTRTT